MNTDAISNNNRNNNNNELPFDVNVKRKSVSFVDEKLIMDALNSAPISLSNDSKIVDSSRRQSNKSNNANNNNHQHYPYDRTSSSSSLSSQSSNNGRQSQNYSNNGAVGAAKRFSNNGRSNYHHQGTITGGNDNHNPSVSGDASANAVILYYNDPNAAIDVEQLLMNEAMSTNGNYGNQNQNYNNQNQNYNNNYNNNNNKWNGRQSNYSNGYQQQQQQQQQQQHHQNRSNHHQHHHQHQPHHNQHNQNYDYGQNGGGTHNAWTTNGKSTTYGNHHYQHDTRTPDYMQHDNWRQIKPTDGNDNYPNGKGRSKYGHQQQQQQQQQQQYNGYNQNNNHNNHHNNHNYNPNHYGQGHGHGGPRSSGPKMYGNGGHSPRSNGKVLNGGGSENATMTPKSEPITIYYNASPNTSEEIEQNLAQMHINQSNGGDGDGDRGNDQIKTKVDDATRRDESNDCQKVDCNASNDTATPAVTNGNNSSSSNNNNNSSSTGEGSNDDGQPENTPMNSTSQHANNNNVINNNNNNDDDDNNNNNNNENDTMVINGGSENIATDPIPVCVNGAGGSDQYDVISGGVRIESPRLPASGDKHMIRCMLVSHPGHFYVKFINAQHDEQLTNMNGFYNSDEHIELTVDVLKAGQYFAASRPIPSTNAATAEDSTDSRQWIRVQLLNVESAELINCLLIDEGCFGMFKLTDLQPLYSQFRTVPKQAIRASLAGVIPHESDYLPKQALDFKNLVTDRKFHTGAQRFDQSQYDERQCLDIELYFTDGDELLDKSVSQIVIDRNIASKK